MFDLYTETELLLITLAQMDTLQLWMNFKRKPV